MAQYALPSTLAILLDNKYLKEEYFGDRHLIKLVKFLLDNIIHIIKKRRRQLTYPYWEENQPKIIFIRPLPKPAFSLADPDRYKNIRRKYSSDLEEITAELKVTLANMDELNCSQRVLFDDFGNLSDYGIERFWKSLSDFIRRGDRDEHNTIKQYRTSKKNVASQTFTQQTTLNPNAPTFVPAQSKQSGGSYNINANIPNNAEISQHQLRSSNENTFNHTHPANFQSPMHSNWKSNGNQNSTSYRNQARGTNTNHPPAFNSQQQYNSSYPQNDRFHVNNL